ncbi:hypothetical protein VNO77_25860 [Canavalia gladiata]|uniref:Uncharacterized protein n=1 Tax=Canavalia gladiata TaxID=3824 RepID=A0AAN9KV10_CANGL
MKLHLGEEICVLASLDDVSILTMVYSSLSVLSLMFYFVYIYFFFTGYKLPSLEVGGRDNIIYRDGMSEIVRYLFDIPNSNFFSILFLNASMTLFLLASDLSELPLLGSELQDSFADSEHS